MDFSTNKNDFLSALTTLSKITPNRTTLPVLSSALIKAQDSKITIRTTDLELEMTFVLRGTILKEGEVCAPIHKLLEITQNILDDEVSIHVNETNRMRIKNSKGKYLVACTGTEEFPEERNNEDNTQKIATEFLSDTIKNTTYCCSKDELKPVLGGVLVSFSTSSVTSVATDGHRLTKFIYPQENTTTTNIIVPQKFLNIISTGAINLKKAELSSTENYITIQTQQQTLSCRLITEKFPDYDAVIPQENSNTTTINTQEFLGAIKRVSLMSNKTTKQIILNISNNKIELSAEDHETGGSATEELFAQHQGEDLNIGFNSTLLLEILKHQKTEEINLLTSGPLNAALIQQKEENTTQTTTLLMPIRI